MVKRVLGLTLALVLGAFVVPPGDAHAQSYPNKPIRLIVPFAAGGAVDALARLLGSKLSEAVGQLVLVENRAGVGGNLGADAVAKSPPDGYTILQTPNGMAITPALYRNLPFDPLKDFAPISILGTNPLVLGVHISVPANTLVEFIDYVKAHPGKLSYSSGGTGSTPHLSAALFASRAGLKMTHIPYKGAQAVTDLVGGQVQMSFGNTSDMIQHSKSGKIRMLAATGEKRMPQLPDLPAIAEFYPGFRTIVWNGLLAPSRTPKTIIDRVAQEVAKAAHDPVLIERLNKIGVDALGNTPAEFAALLRSEAPLWRDAVNAAGIKQE